MNQKSGHLHLEACSRQSWSCCWGSSWTEILAVSFPIDSWGFSKRFRHYWLHVSLVIGTIFRCCETYPVGKVLNNGYNRVATWQWCSVQGTFWRLKQDARVPIGSTLVHLDSALRSDCKRWSLTRHSKRPSSCSTLFRQPMDWSMCLHLATKNKCFWSDLV